MTDELSRDTLRQVLALLFPMQGVVVIGAGRGKGLEGFRSAPSLLLVDARAGCIEQVQTRALERPNAMAVQAVIAGRSAPAEFHLASKPDESALIPPEELRPLWRNLKTHGVEAVETLTLVDLLAGLEPTLDFRCNWLVVDCLPALPVLEGAGRLIDDVEVVELRCISDGSVPSELGANLATIAQWLEARGFRLLLQTEETHPLLHKAVFCRDARKQGEEMDSLQTTLAAVKEACADQAQALTAESNAKSEALAQCEALAAEVARLEQARLVDAKTRDEQAKLATHRATQVEALTQVKTAAEKLAADRQTQLDALNKDKAALVAARDAAVKERDALTAERDALAKAKTALTQSRDEQAKLAADRAIQLDELTRAKSAAEKLAADRQIQLDALNKDNAALVAARDAAVKERDALTTERDALVKGKAAAEKLAAARQVQLDALIKEKAAAKKASGDADIDDMISDLKPFFSGRHITYVDVGAYVGDVLLLTFQ